MLHRHSTEHGDAASVVAPTRASRLLATLHAYFMLTKPRVIELLLVTTVPPMILAEGGWPSTALIGAVLVGGAAAAGGANTINCWIERDRDHLMRRTHLRPLPKGDVKPNGALAFGIGLNVFAFLWLAWTANLLAASLAIGATLFYVFVYTIWLKPRSTQNIVIGGAAGAVPVLVGWAAVTGSLAAPAWVLFALIFVWTPPHFWALSVRYKDDYAAAGIPMLPVVKGIDYAATQIVGYAVVVLGVSLILPLVASVGALYVAVAVVGGLGFVWKAIGLKRDPDPQRAIKVFTYSNVYLASLFVAVAVDVLIRAA
ncbi:MAG: protoheme farnesyltransferase [Actinomycetia bacterium]|nr:protoheme farnesyltransferase [Actinomycetes bacterium]